MIASPEEFDKWDLITYDRDLEDIIIKEYEGTLFEDQHEVINLRNGIRVYAFYNLDYNLLDRIFDNYGENFQYRLIGSKDSPNEGAYIEVAGVQTAD